MDINSRLGNFNGRPIRYPRGRYNNGEGGTSGRRRRENDAIVDPIAERLLELKRIILEIGDKGHDLGGDLTRACNVLMRDYDNQKEAIINQFVGCVSELPFKAPVYATLIGLINLKRPTAGTEIILGLQQRAFQCLIEKKWNEFRCILRFFAESVNSYLLQWPSVLALWEDLIAIIQNSDERAARRDYFASTIISGLPYVSTYLRNNALGDLNRVFSVLSEYLASRVNDPTRQSALEGCRVFSPGNCPYEQIDELQLLWEQMKDLETNNWEQQYTIRPWRDLQDTLENQQSLVLGTIDIPPDHDSYKYHILSTVFQIFEPTMTDIPSNKGFKPNVPPLKSIGRFLMTDIIVDTVNIFDCNPKESANYILRKLRSAFEFGVLEVIPELETSENTAKLIEGDSYPKWSLDQIVVEHIFSCLFKLPSPPQRIVYYHVLLTELSRIGLKSYPRLIGKSIHTSFNRIEYMDFECLRRFVDWFAHHLSNFSYIWNWGDWEYSLENEPTSKAISFIREVINKCIRLSYYDRIKQTIPDSYSSIIPDEASAPNFTYSLPEISEQVQSFSKLLVANMRQKVVVGEIENMLEEFARNMAGDDVQVNVHDILVQVILHLGSKSFSHTLNILERYLPILKKYNKTADQKVQTLKSAATFWVNNQQFLCIVIDKLLTYRIIDAVSVANWIFESGLAQNLHQLFVNEALIIALSKVVSRADILKQKVEEARITNMENGEDSDEALKTFEFNLEAALREKKDFFLTTFQKLAIMVNANAIEGNANHWNDWASGYLMQLLRLSYPRIQEFLSTIEGVVFTDEMEESVVAARKIWEYVNAGGSQLY